VAAELNAQTLRRDAIVRILRQNAVARQAELVGLLHKEGYEATSPASAATCVSSASSRAPTATCCRVEDALTPSHFETVRTFVKGYRAAGPSLTVLRTTIGGAQSVAAALDKAAGPRSSARSPATTRSSSPRRAHARSAGCTSIFAIPSDAETSR